MGQLDRKVVIIASASGGIGKAVAECRLFLYKC